MKIIKSNSPDLYPDVLMPDFPQEDKLTSMQVSLSAIGVARTIMRLDALMNTALYRREYDVYEEYNAHLMDLLRDFRKFLNYKETQDVINIR